MIALRATAERFSMVSVLLLLVLYLVVGRILYRKRWPNGLFPPRIDAERERQRRQKRTRVLEHEDLED